jgi:hypothetical protein
MDELSGEHARAGRRTQRRLGRSFHELDAVRRDPIPHAGEHVHRRRGLIVGEDEHDVRPDGRTQQALEPRLDGPLEAVPQVGRGHHSPGRRHDHVARGAAARRLSAAGRHADGNRAVRRDRIQLTRSMEIGRARPLPDRRCAEALLRVSRDRANDEALAAKRLRKDRAIGGGEDEAGYPAQRQQVVEDRTRAGG